jgi:ABC-type sugar transport system substrate-binding protein
MKKLVLVFMAVLLAAVLCACGGPQRQDSGEEPEHTREPSAEPAPEEPPVAFVMAGENGYTTTVTASARPVIEAGGYRMLEYYPQDAASQLDDMYSAIGEGAKCIVVMPIDMDNLQPVLDECDLLKLPVVNIMVPANGLVRVLISPDYQYTGELAAAEAARVTGGGARVLTVETKASPFVTQLVHDGFHSRSGEMEGVEIMASVLVDNDADDTYQKTKKALEEDGEINCVFVIDEYLADHAVRAVQETGRDISVIATGGGSAMQQSIRRGDIAAGVFSSPYELAKIACGYALMAANGQETGIPQYAGLRTEVINAENLQQYENGVYADVMLPPAVEEPAAGDGDGNAGNGDVSGQDTDGQGNDTED